ncbi:MAG: GLPGLI family protein [Cyclobacteriaceae bacterium]|jgi:GLPGLI family protein
MNFKKLKLIALFVFCFTLSSTIQAQKLQGMATYKTASKLNFPMDSSLDSSIDQQAIKSQLSKALQREYNLSFNTYESTYKKVASLDGIPKASSGGVSLMVMGGDGVIYRNIKTKEEVENVDLFGKPFLIEDKPTPLGWEIKNEFKQIGNYECQKATYTREVNETTLQSDSKTTLEEVTKEVEVVAWFTKDIPVNHGPDEYWGLPGLILEVNNGRITIVCTKVVLNPEQRMEIKQPKGGKTISKADYAALQEEKMAEMMKQYRGKGEGTFKVRIGG